MNTDVSAQTTKKDMALTFQFADDSAFIYISFSLVHKVSQILELLYIKGSIFSKPVMT